VECEGGATEGLPRYHAVKELEYWKALGAEVARDGGGLG